MGVPNAELRAMNWQLYTGSHTPVSQGPLPSHQFIPDKQENQELCVRSATWTLSASSRGGLQYRMQHTPCNMPWNTMIRHAATLSSRCTFLGEFFVSILTCFALGWAYSY